MLVRSVAEVRDLELREMSELCDLLTSEVSQANAGKADAEQYAGTCLGVAQAILRGFQLQDAATVELINHLALDPSLDDKTKRLLANLNEARRAGLRRSETSRPLGLTLVAAE